MQRRKFCKLIAAAAAASSVSALGQTADAGESPEFREHILLDNGWFFTKDDPAGIDSSSLLYDARPVSKGDDQHMRAVEDTSDAAQLGAATHPVLRPWILPTGNPLIKDKVKRFRRPDGDGPGANIPYVPSTFDDLSWTKVNLSHDWAIAGPFNGGGVDGSMGRLPSPGIGWYRKKIHISASDAGKSVFVEVDGAMSYAAVWLNGKLVGGWPYGYASWQLDLTPYLVIGGDNQLDIRLDNPPDFSRWYPGAGIYRHVWLIKTNPVHVAQWGTFVTTPQVSKESAWVKLEAKIDNDSHTPSKVDISTSIYSMDSDPHPGSKPVSSMPEEHLKIAAQSHSSVTSSIVPENPNLWGPLPLQKPNRYLAVTTLLQNGTVIDHYETPFGIRRIEYKPDGLYVNGERVRIQGVNLHHDLGALGAAFNLHAAERQLQELQENGCNAIRTAHNPPGPELLDLTDRMGFLVMDEAFDAWMRQKTPFDFHLIFSDWHEQDLRSMIYRDRNHPSVMIWSVGNEVGEQYTCETGAAVARDLVAIAHDEDPTRPTTASMNFAKPDSPFAAAMDVVSLNYQGEGIQDPPEFANCKGLKTPSQYDAFHRKSPIFSSESASAFSGRDNDLFPVASGISNPVRDDTGGDSRTHQVSAYELYVADCGSSADKVFAMQDKHPYVAGEFVWSGWDYPGEPAPYDSSRSSYFGIIDLAELKKDRFYLYQSRWRADLPMAHILPHWTWPERVGEVTPVHVFTSGDEAELFLNGKSLGRKKKGSFEYRLCWDNVVYQPRILKTVAHKNGKVWASDEVRTAGAPSRLKIEPDRKRMRADGTDLSFLVVTITDKDGVTNPRAMDRIDLAIDGPGEIVATDNGDPTDMEVFSSHDRKAFHGKCVAIVRSKAGSAGTIHLTASVDGLQNASVRWRTDRGEPAPDAHRPISANAESHDRCNNACCAPLASTVFEGDLHMKIAPYACVFVLLASTGFGWLAPYAELQNSAQTAGNQTLQATMKADGSYALNFLAGGWKLEGKLRGAAGDLKKTSGTDRIGAFHQISVSFLGGKRTAEIRVYEDQPVALFRDDWKIAGANAAPFPTFDSLPQDTHRVSFQKSDFGVYEFGKLGLEGPWTFFDKQDHAMILSPADHFLVSTMEEKPGGTATSGIVPAIQQMPAGFTHSTLIAAGSGINHVFSIWGSALLALGEKQRPANNANVTLAKLGYWTDNRTTYYYKFDPKLGYVGTLLAVRDEFKKLKVPLGYMQLDSWFYPKGPQFGWMYGTATPEWGEDVYRADKTLFPQGLDAFHRELGLPLAVHARWVSSESPYHHEFKMSGNVVIDPRFWKQTADYLHQAGVVTYEQDWLNTLAQTEVTLTDPALFLGGMARGMADRDITIQYCTPLPSDYMASTLYPNVQTVRTSGDGFGHGEWDNFLYDSRLASAVGLWPWTDASFSKDLGNLVISTLSAGPVGVGDAIGEVDVKNLLAVVRKDGTIIKPDTSLLPIDALYQHDAAGEQFPMIAAAATTFGNLKIQYVFAYPRQDSDLRVTVPLRELGVSGSVFAYNWVTHKGQLMPPDGSLTLEFADGWAYQVLIPVTRSGLALLGDTDKITPLGRALIADMSVDGNTLSATIQFTSGERVQTIFGYAARRPTIKAVSGKVKDVTYSEESHIFTSEVAPDRSGVAGIQITAE